MANPPLDFKEPIWNIGFPCEEHAPKPGKFTGQDPELFVGKIVKLGFPYKLKDGKESKEHMWVKVLKLGDQTQLEGVLNNDPVRVTDYAYGDGVGFDVEEIEEVVP